VLDVRESKSRPTQGVLSVATRGYTQKGTLVVDMRRSVMVWKREFAPANDLFPVPQEH
jgi:itaconyl-CoA hydratase